MLFIYVYFLDYWNYFRVLREERAEGVPESLETKRHIIENTATNILSVEFFLFWFELKLVKLVKGKRSHQYDLPVVTSSVFSTTGIINNWQIWQIRVRI